MYKEKLKMFLLAWLLLFARTAYADPKLIAIGTVNGLYEDFAEANGRSAGKRFSGNRLGGIGSGLAYAGGNTFLAIPDRGPNATPYQSLVDNTVSYISRFHTFKLSLAPSDPGSALIIHVDSHAYQNHATVEPHSALVRHQLCGGFGQRRASAERHQPHPLLHWPVGQLRPGAGHRPNLLTLVSTPKESGSPTTVVASSSPTNTVPTSTSSTAPRGRRMRSYAMPANLAITNLSPQRRRRDHRNTAGRVTNKGMEGLAITPDGKMLVGIMQANPGAGQEQGACASSPSTSRSGATHEYAYQLSDGSGVSEILAVNDHQFLVDERDGNGLADTPLLTDTASAAKVKKLYLIDLAGAVDITALSGSLAAYAVSKQAAPFLDIAAKLIAAGIDPHLIPSKIEGVTFGQDVVMGGVNPAHDLHRQRQRLPQCYCGSDRSR